MDKECAYLVPDRGQRCGLTRRLLLLLLRLLLNLKHNLNVLVLAASTLEEDWERTLNEILVYPSL
jgi:hypothetical protein